MALTHVFFDIGGVLGTNGWDSEQRARAAQRFGLEGDVEHRHDEVVGEFETGAMTLEEYLDVTVFYTPRPFSREDFATFMLAQSAPHSDTVEIARRLATAGHVCLMTMNNESARLNVHRIERFGLRGIFDAFLSSCWLGVRKPSRAFFERALGIAQVEPGNSLLVDDRAQNVAVAAAVGMQVVQYSDPESLARSLTKAGLF